jgi:hypothetical protein
VGGGRWVWSEVEGDRKLGLGLKIFAKSVHVMDIGLYLGRRGAECPNQAGSQT